MRKTEKCIAIKCLKGNITTSSKIICDPHFISSSLEEHLLLLGTNTFNGKRKAETQLTAHVPQGKEGSRDSQAMSTAKQTKWSSTLIGDHIFESHFLFKCLKVAEKGRIGVLAWSSCLKNQTQFLGENNTATKEVQDKICTPSHVATDSQMCLIDPPSKPVLLDCSYNSN